MNIIPNILLLLTVVIAPVKQENTVRYDANTVNSLQIQKCSICNDTVLTKQNTVNTCDYQIQIKNEKTADVLQEKETTISKIRPQNTNNNYSIVKSHDSFSTAVCLHFNRYIANKVEKTADVLQEKETVISKIRPYNTNNNYSIVKSYDSFSTAVCLHFNRYIANNAFQDRLMYNMTNKHVITNSSQSLIYNTYLLDSHKISIASTILYDVMINSLQLHTNLTFTAIKSEFEQQTLNYTKHNITKYIDGDEPTYVKRSRFDSFSGEYGSTIWYLIRIGKRCEEEGNIEKADKYYNELLNVIMENSKRKYIPIH